MAITATNIRKGYPKGGDDSRGGRRATVKYDVDTNDPLDNLVTVLNNADTPKYPASYDIDDEVDPGLFLTSREAEREIDSKTKWVETQQYETIDRDRAETKVDNPLLEPIQRSWDTASEPRPFERDADGVLVVNLLGLPFDPPIEVQKHFEIGVFVRNEQTFDNVVALSFIDHVNADQFFNFAAGQVLLTKIRPVERFNQAIGQYFNITYTFHAKLEGWLHEEPNRSFYERKDPNDLPAFVNGIKRILDADGKPLAESSLLDAEGIHITSKELIQGAAGGGKDPFYLSFKRYPQTAFGPLNLD